MTSDNDADILTVESYHGLRTWRRIGETDYTRRDGKEIKVAEWEAACAICGAAFRVITPLGARRAESSKSFAMATCQ
jgi:hypothetical protein